MTFREWFEKRWLRKGETETAALQRLSAETGISYKSLFYVAKGCRCTTDTAKRVEEFTKKKVLAAELVLLPTRSEMGFGRTGTEG